MAKIINMRTAVHNTDTLPVSHYWGLIKGIDRSQKLELATMIMESLRDEEAADRVQKEQEEQLKPYTIEELHARIAESERQIAAGQYQDFDEAMDEIEAELAREKKLKPYTMEEINAMIDESERQIAAGQYKPIEEVFRRWNMEDSDMVAEEETEYGAV